MHISKQKIGLAVAGLLSISVLAVAPVYAHVSDDSSSTPTSGSTSKSGSGSKTTTESKTQVAHAGETHAGETEDEVEIETEHGVTTNLVETTGDVQTLRQKGKDLLDAKRVGKPAKAAAVRQKVCTDRSAAINKRFNQFDANAAKHLTKLNATYAKLQAFQAKNQLPVSTYAALTSTADANKVAATDAVAALNSVSTDVDCTTADPAAAIATVKAAVKNAHDALQTYRKSVKDVLVALMTAKNASTTKTPDTTTTPTASPTPTTSTENQ